VSVRPAIYGLVLLVALAACERPSTRADREVDPTLVEVDRANLVLRTDRVGVGDDKPTSTFVLVDAHNTADQPLAVTLGGVLTDAAGEPVGALRADSLWIPPDGIRTFALVERDLKSPEAAGARVEVIGAVAVDHEPAVYIDDSGGAFFDQGRVVVNGNVVNTAGRAGKVIVIAGFYDADGRLLERPFQVLTVGSGAKRPVQFVGPEGSRKGYMFIGDAVF
jgi:hypothetical protein